MQEIYFMTKINTTNISWLFIHIYDSTYRKKRQDNGENYGVLETTTYSSMWFRSGDINE